MLDDECGKSLPALTVFSLSIRFMMEGLIHMCTQEKIGLDADDIHWMLTVPAIWDDSAKSFMRLAAQENKHALAIGDFVAKVLSSVDNHTNLKAGISSEKLTIALEPEAASIYCRHMPVQKDGATGISSFRSGKKYLVLDAGGGTIDVTVHEVCFGGEIKELYKATGGAWGGTVVDQAFLDFIGELIGKDILEKFKNEQMEDYIELLREFEHKKRETDLKSHGKVTMRLPIIAISGILHAEKKQTLQQIIDQSVHAGKISLISDKIRLDNDLFRSFFKGSVDSIFQHLSSLLRKPETSGVETILMVGGYSESPLLRESIQNKFPSMRILVPQDAGLAVLKGAVLFGHYPTSIKSRVSKYTYGFDVTDPFNADKHPSEKRKLTDIGYICEDIFYVMVRAGQTLTVGENQYVSEVSNANANQKDMTFRLFCTTKNDVTFVTDDGCKEIGSFEVLLSGSGLNRSVSVQIMFGGTEIVVECKEKSIGRKTKCSVDFLM